MRSEVHFTHMDRSPSLEQFAIEKFEGIVEEFLNRREAHCQIWLVNEKPEGARGAHQFRCEVSVRFAPKREIFVAKTAIDMYDAINTATQSLMDVIREESKKEQKARRRKSRQPDYITV